MEKETQIAPTFETEINSKEINQLNTQTPETPKQKSFLVMGLIVLVFVLLGVGGFFAYQNYQLKKDLAQKISLLSSISETINKAEIASPTPIADPTADWKTYSNEINNYSFKYPPFASVEESNFMGTIQSTTITLNEEKFIDIYIQLTENWNGTDNANLKEKNYSVNGIPALKESRADGQNPPQQIVYFEANSIIYRIQLNYTGEQEYADLFDQILSSFEFIENNTSQTTWKSNKEELSKTVEAYLSALLNEDRATAITYLTKKVKSQVDDYWPQGYGHFKTTEVLNEYHSEKEEAIFYNNDPIYFTVKFYEEGDKTGKLANLMFTKEDGKWKTLSWYLFP